VTRRLDPRREGDEGKCAGAQRRDLLETLRKRDFDRSPVLPAQPARLGRLTHEPGDVGHPPQFARTRVK